MITCGWIISWFSSWSKHVHTVGTVHTVQAPKSENNLQPKSIEFLFPPVFAANSYDKNVEE